MKSPATPLPWLTNDGPMISSSGENGAMRLVVAEEIHGRNEDAAYDNAVYLSHAANAYPKLVGTIQHYLERFKDHEALLTREQLEAIRAMRTVLRELGEIQ